MAACKKSSHPLHHPKPPRRQRQAVAAYGSVFAGGVRRTPDGAAVALGHAVGELRHPKRIPRRTKASQHVAMLVARLGGGEPTPRFRFSRARAVGVLPFNPFQESAAMAVSAVVEVAMMQASSTPISVLLCQKAAARIGAGAGQPRCCGSRWSARWIW